MPSRRPPVRHRLLCAAACILLGGAAQAAGSAPAEAVFVHLAARGDTLIGLGQRYLIDPTAWPELARVNQVRNPKRIPLGTALRIPLRLMHSEPVAATVTSVIGDVRLVAAGPVTAGQALPEGSNVSTGNDGGMTVRLVDGTLLRLRSSSRLQIDESRRIRAAAAVRSGVKLDQGRIEVEAETARGGQPGFRIGTPQGVLGVRGTEFRVTVDAPRSITRTEVLTGVVAVAGADTAADAGQRVAAGFGSVLDGAARVTPPVPLLAAPDVSGAPELQERPLVRVSVPALAGAAAYRAQVAGDAVFDRIVAELESASPELRFAGLPDGEYRMRVRGVDANGLEGRNADLRFRLKARPEPPLPNAPAPRAVFYGDRVELAWAANDEAQTYRLQLAPSAGFGTLSRDLRELRETRLAVDGLAPGRYWWRLASVRAGADQGPWGAVQDFELRQPPPVPPPPQVGDQSIRFAWEGTPGQTFDVHVARDTTFARLLVERRLDAPGIELPFPGTGRFYIRLRARDPDGFVGPFTAPQYFDVPNCVRDGSAACVQADGKPLLLLTP